MINIVFNKVPLNFSMFE